MKVRNLLVSLLIVLTGGVSAEEPIMGPLIDGYGPTYRVDERDMALPDGFVYKTVFDIGQDPKPGEVNPNLQLLGKLQEAGVQVYLCGQSMVHSGIQKEELVSGVQVGLSAMTRLTILQASGYALIPWGA